MYNTVLLLTLVALVSSHDVIVGTNTDGRKIYDEVRHASPTIWRQTENVTITTTDAEVISRVVVTDRRPDKDGEAKVVDGGEGQKNVTLELKSPTVLRGYDFQIEVFSIPEDKFKFNDKTAESQTPNPTQTRIQRNPLEDRPSFNIPRSVLEDPKNLKSTPAKANPTPMMDTKVNDDDTKSIEDDSEDVAQLKNRDNAEVKKDIQDHNIHVRDALNAASTDTKQQEKEKDKQSDGHHENLPKINTPVISTPAGFGRYPQPTNNDKTESKDSKRDARGTENGNIGVNHNTTPKSTKEYSSIHPAHPRFSSDSPILSQTMHKDQSENAKKSDDGKREVRDTETSTKSDMMPKINLENSSVPPAHPKVSLDSPIFSQLPNVESNDEKRVARDFDHGKSDNINTTPKTNAESSSITPAHPKISEDTINTSTVSPDSKIQKDEHNDDINMNLHHQGHFVPPLGYKKMVSAYTRMEEKERSVRDVNHSDKPLSPTLFAKSNDDSDKNDSTDNEDSKLLSKMNLHIPRSQYPLPYPTQAITSTNSPSTTTIKQTKRETEAEDSKTDKEGNFGSVPRTTAERNSTVIVPKPVISIQ